jgi:23S rRNA (adenine2503-C2)-methyltransferase
MDSDLPNLYGMDRAGLAAAIGPFTTRPFHADQVYHWMHGRHETDFRAMTELPAALREELARSFRAAWPSAKDVRLSSDGSRKYLLALEDGAEIEAVYIVYGSRITFCLSSQIGCPLDCRFCLTGTMGLLRNLTPGEIVGQAAVLARDTKTDPKTARIVFMGMGEPLNNYDAVMKAFRILIDPKGFGMTPRRITLSTAGLVPGIERLARENPRPRLAVSLGAADDTVRGRLMPINKKFDLTSLLDACRRFPLGPRERVTFEYVLLDGVNDSREDARKIGRLLRGVKSKVNIIPYNDTGLPGFTTPPRERAARFRDALLDHGVPSTIRWSKGSDIGAACGQLVREPPEKTDSA